MFDFFNPLKGYIAAAGAAVIAVLIAVFKYRGNRINELERVVSAKNAEIEVAGKLADADKKAADFVADNRVAAAKGEVNVENVTTYDPNTKFYI